jgi:Ser-tRNA(Ala) deacylase AlaX
MPPKAAKKSAAPLNTALFVLKGAVATVLNRLTVTVSASNNKLVIVAKEMLTDDQIAKILQLANDKVKENAPVSFEDLERAVVS